MVSVYDLSVMFLLRYGKHVTVDGTDDNQPHRLARLGDASVVYVYYFDQTGKPIEAKVAKDAATQASPPLPARFSVPIQLEGYEVTDNEFKPGESLVLFLYWRALEKIEKDYIVFVHLLDRDGNQIAGYDRSPREGKFPTSAWTPGALIVDHIVMMIPPGSWRVEIIEFKWECICSMVDALQWSIKMPSPSTMRSISPLSQSSDDHPACIAKQSTPLPFCAGRIGHHLCCAFIFPTTSSCRFFLEDYTAIDESVRIGFPEIICRRFKPCFTAGFCRPAQAGVWRTVRLVRQQSAGHFVLSRRSFTWRTACCCIGSWLSGEIKGWLASSRL